MSDVISNILAEDAVDRIFDLLAEDAGYISPSDDNGIRYAPDAALLELIAWNIVVAFWVNVTASYFFARFSKDKKASKDIVQKQRFETRIRSLEEELSSTRRELSSLKQYLRILKETNILLRSLEVNQSTVRSLQIDASKIKQILIRWGWPKSEAKVKAKALVEEIKRGLKDTNE